MGDFIGVDIQGIEELKTFLKDFPPLVFDDVTDAISEYLINVYRHYASYRHITRKQAYGRTFVSDKQRKWFFASLGDGSLQIPYRRTQELSRGWKQVGKGRNSIIANETPHAQWAQGPLPQDQARLLRIMGWKAIEEINRERESEIERRGDAAAQRAIKKAGG